MRWTVANRHFMRERGSVTDLLAFAGGREDEGVVAVLARVEAACAAAKRTPRQARRRSRSRHRLRDQRHESRGPGPRRHRACRGPRRGRPPRRSAGRGQDRAGTPCGDFDHRPARDLRRPRRRGPRAASGDALARPPRDQRDGGGRVRRGPPYHRRAARQGDALVQDAPAEAPRAARPTAPTLFQICAPISSTTSPANGRPPAAVSTRSACSTSTLARATVARSRSARACRASGTAGRPHRAGPARGRRSL